MVRVTEGDLHGDTDFLEYISSSDGGSDLEEVIHRDPDRSLRFAELVPEVPPLNKEFPTVVVVAGLPAPEKDRREKLKMALSNRITKTLTAKDLLPPGPSPFTVDILVVKDSAGQSMCAGVGFITFSKNADIPAIVEGMSSMALDSKHILRVGRLDDLPSFLEEPKYRPPTDASCFRRDGFRDWMSDPLGREQYAYRCALDSDVMWFDGIARSADVVCKEHERFGFAFCWSPMGSYFLTIHKRGVWVRGNDSFQKMMCFNHKGVKHALFSPNEEYLITYDGTYGPAKPREPQVIVWEVSTGTQLATLSAPPFSPNGVRPEDGAAWPYFLFSPDSKYLAARRENGLAVYETATMRLLDETTATAAGRPLSLTFPLEQFRWSPADNLLSLWIPECGDSPGRLLIVDIPTGQEVASKNVFSVKSVSMHWRPCGEFLALNTVILRKVSKKVKKEVTQIEIFRVKERSVPVDMVDLEGYRVRSLHWEEGLNGASRFATLTADETTSSQSINFFDVPVRGAKEDTKLVQSLTVPPTINGFSWSPRGQYFLAASKGGEGALIFGVLNEQNKAEIIQKDEHMDLTDVMWDPSGRYVTTAVLVPPGAGGYRYSTNAGFRIYSFLGRQLFRFQHQDCMQFLWRPRPALMISREKLEDILKRMKEYSKRYDAQDEMRRTARQLALKQEGTGKMAAFMEAFKRGKDYVKNHPKAKEWERAWNTLNERLEWREETATWEEVVEVTREKFKKPGS